MGTTFNLEVSNKPSRKSTYAIYLRITQDRKKKRIKTSIEVNNIRDFNLKAKNGKWIRTSEANHQAWNESLKNELEKARKTFEKLGEDGMATKELIKATLQNSTISTSFLGYAKQRTQDITAIGTSAALAVVKRPFAGKNLFSTLVIAPLVLPEIVLAVGLLVATVWTGVPLGYGTLIAGHVLVSIPFSFLIVRAAASGLDPRLDEAAADLGAHGGQIFMRVTLPLLAPAILSAFLLCAVISFDNFVVSTFVSGVGSTPLPIQIYAMLKTGLTPKINALGAMLIAVNVLVILIVMSRYLKTIRRPG